MPARKRVPQIAHDLPVEPAACEPSRAIVKPGEILTLPELGARIGKARLTVWNWVTKGVSINGRRVKLQARRIGHQWSVRPDEWEQFERDCNPEARPLPESPAASKRRAERARRLALLLTCGVRDDRGKLVLPDEMRKPGA